MVVGEFTIGADVLVIGGGPGGYEAAIRAAQLGRSVTLVEKGRLGGICLHEGCIPSKSIITKADLFHKIRQSANQGIMVNHVTVKMDRLQFWKQGVIDQLEHGVNSLMKGNGISVVQGDATFVSENEVRVVSEHGSERYRFQHCIVATGSIPTGLPGFPFDGQHILSSRDALALGEVPEKLIVIGGGYIGLELGTAYRKLGSEVTVLEGTNQLLLGIDEGLVRVVTKNLKKLGVDIHLNAIALGYERIDGELLVKARVREETKTFSADQVLVAVGRKPNTSDLCFEYANVAVDRWGFIQTDQQLRTTNPKVFAIGDVAGQPMLAHKASHEGKVAAEVIAGMPSVKDEVAIPMVIFTDPEIASVGLTVSQAREEGIEVVSGRRLFSANGRALTIGSDEGFVQIVADKATSQVIGVHIAGPEASTLLAEAALAIEMCATVHDLSLTLHAHPTLPENVREAADSIRGKNSHSR